MLSVNRLHMIHIEMQGFNTHIFTYSLDNCLHLRKRTLCSQASTTRLQEHHHQLKSFARQFEWFIAATAFFAFVAFVVFVLMQTKMKQELAQHDARRNQLMRERNQLMRELRQREEIANHLARHQARWNQLMERAQQRPLIDNQQQFLHVAKQVLHLAEVDFQRFIHECQNVVSDFQTKHENQQVIE